MRHLLLGLGGFAAQAFAARVGLFEPHAVHTVVGAQLAERLRQRVDGAVQLLAALIEPIDARAPFGDAALQFRQIQFRLLYPLAQHVELLAAFDDPVADVFAAVDAQPVGAEPDAVARDDAFAVSELRRDGRAPPTTTAPRIRRSAMNRAARDDFTKLESNGRVAAAAF